jgi:hypothetical protein
MSSSKQTAADRARCKIGVMRLKDIKTRVNDIDEAGAHYIAESYLGLIAELDKIPMTRAQREEVDVHIRGIGYLLSAS